MTIIILTRTVDAYKAAKHLGENKCISTDVILMFDEITEKSLHDVLSDLSDVNSIRLDNLTGYIAHKAVDDCCVNKLRNDDVASTSEYMLNLSLGGSLYPSENYIK